MIPERVRLAVCLILIAGLTASAELLLAAYFPALNRALGIFVPLIALNCVILTRTEGFAAKNGPIAALADGLSMGLGFTAALILLAAVREILGAGSFCGIPLFGDAFKPAVIFLLPAGAFLALGFILAAVQKLSDHHAKKADPCAAEGEEEADA